VGVGLYALVAAGIMALVSWGLWYKAEAADGRAKSAEHLVDQYKTDLAESEADKALFKARNKQADETVKARELRMGVLEHEKRQIKAELDGLKKSVAPEDQSCLDRGLPDAFAERLRERSDSKDKDRPGTDPGKPDK
jgi:hypothetical protein